ncbi:Uncharacterised protein [Chryseobacterium nakagawai]|uniref:NinB protein n=1 Tax=Chryseobacterium nakagawai TaxID=1241982 RepID=A0AAD0YMC4_CHRNA|nr:hypothetical protein [Chryseobacterium nakagawai]AZA91179.1 hypothetical protein EG343_11325 [Chryseobacterium nakagawai]VEH22744.1 Uncharacterised protein [Chryseobacterium nakagawai]
MKSIEIDTRISEGQFRMNKDLIRNAILQFEGKEIKIVFKRKYKKRSNNENAFYWGVWIPILQRAILDTWGEIRDANDVHEIIKLNCNYEEKINEDTGSFIRVPKSSTELNTYEWEFEFKQKIRQFALEFFNVTLPEPNEQLKIEL